MSIWWFCFSLLPLSFCSLPFLTAPPSVSPSLLHWAHYSGGRPRPLSGAARQNASKIIEETSKIPHRHFFFYSSFPHLLCCLSNQDNAFTNSHVFDVVMMSGDKKDTDPIGGLRSQVILKFVHQLVWLMNFWPKILKNDRSAPSSSMHHCFKPQLLFINKLQMFSTTINFVYIICELFTEVGYKWPNILRRGLIDV